VQTQFLVFHSFKAAFILFELEKSINDSSIPILLFPYHILFLSYSYSISILFHLPPILYPIPFLSYCCYYIVSLFHSIPILFYPYPILSLSYSVAIPF